MLKKKTEEAILPKAVAQKSQIAIIRSEFNGEITESLEKHCLAVLLDAGVRRAHVKQYQVPGSLEIPVVARIIAQKKAADVIIALGAVIRGDTYHFELVANECARGCMNVALEFNIPVIFEVLAAYNLTQAAKRAGNNKMNKGREAALVALKMLKLLSNFKR
ncbi:6,7-dimethyl-8-ribityllumazine synthase [Candidatus Curtissbacteria bacterium RIFCSPHIGHO2_01_FULL_41_44]|uniref:6,7-dimethyl-8-ribityllumazine synthase n=1 Tax=Candidatus Curtissbacteria bacterium RIFCSPLOWO2_01_FULL_42_50 TaxID=1797730 RepID=A0A1F5H2T9_9BACT|nr:MAG: 6,7-dimethyl-8-ribityllumazine synthase [Candidatus Curtissbacteria bacterium RIFCSPHIGHO2_02_FULL_42_58]OGD93767.1 MAG: 6,7-dimethyl-8-ribityllumazine synthase [Candidatus Curtissbacteria bacterium RIFCSPHIGHO2_01_FULL_41_44]OGD97265.1 MAG: 6,7-dimethyl-8-ribityllumazine synthase [Candidatus Curtissbacteria bacterium RIFCSPHIGHO2_12_FULL_42_33]OGD98411.1 MAG: 6,7-dimethyl-8-ribityllumazine synthase [Candidatus Curtissbacteria bacterium RIFCSPLOWO2_01_FULL_42_50]OGE02328.1 MAG: 6,7-dime